jgi:hypothetical protein
MPVRRALAPFIALLLTLSCIALLCAADALPDASGAWKWTITIQDSGTRIDHSAKLKQDADGKLTGTFTDGFDNASFDVKDGKVSKDGEVSFKVVRTIDGGADLTLNFSGRLDGDQIKGKLNFNFGDQPMSADWNAKRTKDEGKPATKPT